MKLKIIENEQKIVEILSVLSTQHEDLKKHSPNVMKISVAFGNYLGLSEEDSIVLKLGAYLHDVGKVRVDKQVLYKEGRYTQEEREQMNKHTTLGYDMLKEYGFLNEDLLAIALEHHERVDGSGYPNNKTEINYLAQIVSLCDVYEALTARRCYKQPMSKENAVKIIIEDIENKKFDEKLGNLFVEFIKEKYKE